MDHSGFSRRVWLAGAATAAGLAVVPWDLSAQLVPPTDEPPQTGDPADLARRMKWWRDAKFGMFIHWGLYSVLGRHEWAMEMEGIPVREYEKLAQQFKPKPNAARAWAKLAKQAGMRYMVMTSKHHEGFCHFNSDAHRLLRAEAGGRARHGGGVLEAARAEGLRCGFLLLADGLASSRRRQVRR